MSESDRRDIHGAGLADAVLLEIQRSTDIRDRIPLGLAEECDRLEDMMGSMRAGSRKVTASAQRVRALIALQQAINLRDESKGSDRPVQIIANILRNLKETMKELDLAPELIETVLQTLVVKAEELDAPVLPAGGTPTQAS